MNPHDKIQIAESLEAFNTFPISGKAPFEFRFKKINYNKYEFRVNIKLRVVVKEENDTFYLDRIFFDI